MSLAGTITGQMLIARQRYKTVAGVCTRLASRSRIGCRVLKNGRKARASIVTIRAISTLLFHALFCRTRWTFGGQAACRAAKSLTKNVASFPTRTCGSKGWISGLSQMKATCVRQALRFAREALSCGSSEGGCFRLLKTTVPFPCPWNKHTDVSSTLIRSGAFPGGTWAAQQLYHCHTAWACVLTIWL